MDALSGTRRADLIIPGSQVRVLPRPSSKRPAKHGIRLAVASSQRAAAAPGFNAVGHWDAGLQPQR
jgi:hypothetical protein